MEMLNRQGNIKVCAMTIPVAYLELFKATQVMPSVEKSLPGDPVGNVVYMVYHQCGLVQFYR